MKKGDTVFFNYNDKIKNGVLIDTIKYTKLHKIHVKEENREYTSHRIFSDITECKKYTNAIFLSKITILIENLVGTVHEYFGEKTFNDFGIEPEDLINLILSIEKKYEISISDEIMKNFEQTKVIDFINNLNQIYENK